MTDENLELSVERYIDAPVERVWQVMIDRFDQWFAPSPFRAEARDVEWRPGGRSLVVMHMPTGDEMPIEGVVLDFTPNRRFMFTDAFTANWEPAAPSKVGTWEITSENGGTRYRASARHWTREGMQQHLDTGFEPGWNAVADQLKALAEAKD